MFEVTLAITPLIPGALLCLQLKTTWWISSIDGSQLRVSFFLDVINGFSNWRMVCHWAALA